MKILKIIFEYPADWEGRTQGTYEKHVLMANLTEGEKEAVMKELKKED